MRAARAKPPRRARKQTIGLQPKRSPLAWKTALFRASGVPRARAKAKLSRGLNLRLLLLLLRLVDHLLGDVRRYLLVAEELHVVVAAAAGHRRQRLRVRKDLRHRHLGLDGRHAAARLHSLQPAAP